MQFAEKSSSVPEAMKWSAGQGSFGSADASAASTAVATATAEAIATAVAKASNSKTALARELTTSPELCSIHTASYLEMMQQLPVCSAVCPVQAKQL